jgi:hypothetical protein
VRGDVVLAEIETYAYELSWILDQICVCLDGLTATQLNWRPSGAANSAYAIASHVVGSTSVYALGFGCGENVTRDRAAEFAASGTDAGELIGAMRQLQRKIGDALGRLRAETLDERVLPPSDLWGTDEPHEISRREALVESIRHAALHLGELRLTRGLATDISLLPGRLPPMLRELPDADGR